MKKIMISLILLALSVFLILMSFFGPWYITSQTDSENGSKIYLTKWELALDEGGKTSTKTYDFDESGGTADKDMMDNTLYLTVISFIIIILSMVFCILLYKNIKIKNLKMFISIICILAIIFSLITVFYFMNEVVSSANESRSAYNELSDNDVPEVGFWDTMEYNGIEFTMGPGYSWYFVIIAGIISLISGIILFFDKKKPDIT